MKENSILCIAVHPDDETLGCGATLLKHANSGHPIHWLIVTAATSPQYATKQIREQKKQVMEVCDAYPFAQLHWLKLPATGLDTIPMSRIVKAIGAVVEQLRPHTVYIPNRSDVHSDHRVVSHAAMAVLKSFYMLKLGVRRVLSCEVLSETDAACSVHGSVFAPNTFVDVTETFHRKIQIMSIYKSELQNGFMPRTEAALHAQGRLRGAAIGVNYAEAFLLLREIA